MLIGMGIVFLFLALLVWVINTAAGLLQRFAPDAPSRLEPAGDGGAASAEPIRQEVVAAIMAAVHQYRKKSQ